MRFLLPQRVLAATLASATALASASCSGGRTPPAAEPVPEPAPVVVAPPVDTVVDTPIELVRAMRTRYDGKWYRTLSYFQRNTIPLRSGSHATSEWTVYQSVPGRLRVDFLPLAGKSGLLYLDGRQTTFSSGKVVAQSSSVDPIVLFGADVYALDPDSTLSRLDSLGVARTLREDTWEGRRAFVLGAAAGDTTSNQLWVDADRLLLVRVVRTQMSGTTRTLSETRLTYADVDGVPVPKQTIVFRGGREALRGEFTRVRVNPELPAALFDPARWVETQQPVPSAASR